MFGKIADWHKGYVVWEYAVWKWLLDKGVKIHYYDVGDIAAWAKDGIEGLKNSVTEKEYEFYKNNTYDLNQVTADLKAIYKHPNLILQHKKVSWDDIVAELKKPGICDLTLDGRKLHHADGFTVHRVVLIDISEDAVTFHDPVEDNSGAYKTEPTDHFRSAVESLSGPSLVRYEAPK